MDGYFRTMNAVSINAESCNFAANIVVAQRYSDIDLVVSLPFVRKFVTLEKSLCVMSFVTITSKA